MGGDIVDINDHSIETNSVPHKVMQVMNKMNISSTSTPMIQKQCPDTSCISSEEPLEMERMHEWILFAKEMLSQKPSRRLLKVYLIGSVFAILGTVIGMVEMVSHSLSSRELMDAEMVLMMAQEQSTVATMPECNVNLPAKKEEQEKDTIKMMTDMTFSKVQSQRSLSHRLHASRS
ncbi:G0/G1 switch protein 2 [Syngnathoides biaculeatus]|uniref:G0/G1 switch protein 2 n=1 Tax=Syngnathoides biaculeatus TaxID=300417 RepID=UPI002ADE25F0|nr:G0/G1 switch protein 2 [Syngnathoides biaculeatus]XP_061688512.1 G0/G1 switch protein 2 [Syngnathoides biaculeatus]XP_061688513.1 G0/G1 switch protein 2 [Syngnathoides biaculeatus]XP_061688514.1 G0/G1 switch protein 2 [Syngnathoides biaculeatus]XP_061688515.1 G0/G1 switch protein 2 [Syngnathoides biaculeatus]XP_061688516.1 G0/G1 switch protein 2 [Syngnathoides biaculeatus]XP_061688517.1 G0/G1 switch protein 2 [Syngnathoides biaculeatus]XP_061688518.1 G0/G1 switch protein 2 [Syngnathoides 